MAFREKMLWASAATTVVIWGWYFLGFVRALEAPSFNVGGKLCVEPVGGVQSPHSK